MKETWQAHNEERCAGVNWKIFSGVAQIMVNKLAKKWKYTLVCISLCLSAEFSALMMVPFSLSFALIQPHFQELVQCIGSQVLAEICERFAKGFRHLRAGMPDLVVWSSTTLKYKVHISEQIYLLILMKIVGVSFTAVYYKGRFLELIELFVGVNDKGA